MVVIKIYLFTLTEQEREFKLLTHHNKLSLFTSLQLLLRNPVCNRSTLINITMMLYFYDTVDPIEINFIVCLRIVYFINLIN